jgi:hypothetical protein
MMLARRYELDFDPAHLAERQRIVEALERSAGTPLAKHPGAA